MVTDTAVHDFTIETNPHTLRPLRRALCSCGWSGEWLGSRYSVEAQIAIHLTEIAPGQARAIVAGILG